MSGIIALFNRGEGSVSSHEFTDMHERIKHRGPDSSGTWRDQNVALGYQQLQSTPESKFDDQPYREEEFVVVSDARLDNREELFRKLPISEPREQVPDSQLLLSGYRKWGTKCVEHLVGAFSFIIWDSSSEQMFCARDHFGVKPFYYYVTEGRFAVASEKKSLLELPSVTGEIDELKIGEFLVNEYNHKQRTYFTSINRLQPAHAMTIDKREHSMRQYWDLDPSRTIDLESDSAYEQRFRELFETAVESRLRASSPVGTALSGGLDSSSIAVTAREILPASEPFHTFSNVYEEAPSSDEREYIESISSTDSIQSHFIFDDGLGVLMDEDHIYDYYDQPLYNTMQFAIRNRAKYVQQTDVDVILGGERGDITVSYGFELLPYLLLHGRWYSLYQKLLEMREVADMNPKSVFYNMALLPIVPDQLLQAKESLTGGEVPLSVNPTLSPAFVKRTDIKSILEESVERSFFPAKPRQRHRKELLSGSVSSSFEERDLIHAAFGLEPRYPFADKRLVEFCLAIPPSQQLVNGWTRSLLRRSVGDLLPEKVQWRPWKAYMNEAFWNALRNEEQKMENITRNSGPLTEYLDIDSIRECCKRFEQSPESEDARVLWRALSLSVWLESDYPSGPNSL